MKIAVMAGDGIGPEVTAQAVKVLKAVVGKAQSLELVEAPVGQAGIEAAGDPLPRTSSEIARKADAILFGSAGMPGDEAIPFAMRPGACLLRLRKELELFANFRPAMLFPELVGASTLKPEVVQGLDLMILRELTGDAYFGEPRGFGTNASGEREAFNTMRYSRVRGRTHRPCGLSHCAHAPAGNSVRSTRPTCWKSRQLWREVVVRVAKDYPDVELSHLFVDAAAMQLMRAPLQFDVIVTGNIFGDILSDAAAMLTGSIGMLPSASMGRATRDCTSPCTAPRPTSRARTWPIRWRPSCRWR